MNFAHRGSLTEAPENTLSAMKKALQHKPKAIELDVQLTKDGHLVVVHDQQLTRFNKNFPGNVKDYTLDEIQRIDVGSSFSEEFAGETLATFEELLEIFPKDLLINIEIKNIPIIYEGIEEKVIQALKKYDRMENIVISSFDHGALLKVQQLAPEIPLGMLLYYRILKPWEYAKNSNLNLVSVHPHFSYTDREFVEEFHKLGLKVYPYTVNKMDTYNRLLDIGVDGVFSNNPNIFSTINKE